ncbi:MAG: hypothetical protein ACNA78_05025 [Balneolaceae bacterium]
MRIVILLFLVLLICPMSNYAQSSDGCPNNAAHPKNDSEELLADYLNSNSFESAQAIFNLPDLQNAPIELLTGSSDPCFELNTFRSQHDITSSPRKDYTYYKVSNYYFSVKWYLVNTTAYRNILIFDDQYNLIHSPVF